MASDPKKATTILQANNQDFQYVLSKAKLINELNAKVAVHLDASMRKYCQVANIGNNVLTLIVENGSVATQLRYSLPDCCAYFSQSCEYFTASSKLVLINICEMLQQANASLSMLPAFSL